MGMTIDRWGPAAWNTLHAFAHRSPVSFEAGEQEKWRSFLYLFADFLPCPKCKEHFKSLMERERNRPLRGREDLIILLNDAHNEVNSRLGKRVVSLPEHMHTYSIPDANTNIYSVHVVQLLAVVLLSMCVFRAMRNRRNSEAYS